MANKFKFWKNNKIDEEFYLTLNELEEKFLEWLKTKEKDWLAYYGYSPSLLQFFIGEDEGKKGLQSVGDSERANELWESVKDTKNEYFKEEGVE